MENTGTQYLSEKRRRHYQRQKSKDEISKDERKYWEYCGINIPFYIESVPCIDEVNKVYSDGSETEVDVDTELTLEEYQNKYAIIGSDGKLYWKE